MPLKETLTQRVGGLPVYVWAGGAAVIGVGAMLWIRRGRKGANDAAASLQDQYDQANLGTGGGSGSGAGASDSLPLQYGNLYQGSTVTYAPAPAPAPASNPAASQPLSTQYQYATASQIQTAHSPEIFGYSIPESPIIPVPSKLEQLATGFRFQSPFNFTSPQQTIIGMTSPTPTAAPKLSTSKGLTWNV